MKKNYISPEVTEICVFSGDIIMASGEDSILDAEKLWENA